MLPAAHAHHLVANRIFGVLGFHHLAHRAANHHLTQTLRSGVALAVIHPAAHVGVKAQVMMAHQDLAILQRRERLADELEIRRTGFYSWAVV